MLSNSSNRKVNFKVACIVFHSQNMQVSIIKRPMNT